MCGLQHLAGRCLLLLPHVSSSWCSSQSVPQDPGLNAVKYRQAEACQEGTGLWILLNHLGKGAEPWGLHLNWFCRFVRCSFFPLISSLLSWNEQNLNMKYNRNIITRLLLKTIKGTSYVGFVLAAINGQEQTPPFYHDRRLQQGGSGDVASPSVWMLFLSRIWHVWGHIREITGESIVFIPVVFARSADTCCLSKSWWLSEEAFDPGDDK